MTPIEMLEKLVKLGITFKISNIDMVNPSDIFWLLSSPKGPIYSSPCGFEITAEKAITALYDAAVKAYPERFK